MPRTIVYPPAPFIVRLHVQVRRQSDGEVITFEPVSLWAAWRMTRPRMLRRLFAVQASESEQS